MLIDLQVTLNIARKDKPPKPEPIGFKLKEKKK